MSSKPTSHPTLTTHPNNFDSWRVKLLDAIIDKKYAWNIVESYKPICIYSELKTLFPGVDPPKPTTTSTAAKEINDISFDSASSALSEAYQLKYAEEAAESDKQNRECLKMLISDNWISAETLQSVQAHLTPTIYRKNIAQGDLAAFMIAVREICKVKNPLTDAYKALDLLNMTWSKGKESLDTFLNKFCILEQEVAITSFKFQKELVIAKIIRSLEQDEELTNLYVKFLRGDQTLPSSVEELKEIIQRYKSIQRSKKTDSSLAMAASVVCAYCHKNGHNAQECRSLLKSTTKSNNNYSFSHNNNNNNSNNTNQNSPNRQQFKNNKYNNSNSNSNNKNRKQKPTFAGVFEDSMNDLGYFSGGIFAASSSLNNEMCMLDTGASMHVLRDKKYLKNAEQSDKVIRLAQGDAKINLEGEVGNLGRGIVMDNAHISLISQTQLVDNGIKVKYSYKNDCITLQKKRSKYTFSRHGSHYFGNLERLVNFANAISTRGKVIRFNRNGEIIDENKDSPPPNKKRIIEEIEQDNKENHTPNSVKQEEPNSQPEETEQSVSIPVTQDSKDPVPQRSEPRIEEKKENHTQRDKRIFSKEHKARATQVRELHCSLGHPGDSYFKKLLRYGCIHNCNLTDKDVDIAKEILGECVACGMSKAWNKSNEVRETPPADFVGQQLVADIMFLKTSDDRKTPYMIMVDELSGYVIGSSINSRNKQDIEETIKSAVKFYQQKNFKPERLLTDREKSFISADKIEGLEVVHTGAGQHAARAERNIRSVKDIARSILAQIKYKVPRNLLTFLIDQAVRLKNLHWNSHSIDQSPNIVVTGKKITMNQLLKSQFGKVGVFKVINPSNDLSKRYELGMVLGFETKNPDNIIAYIPSRDSIVVRHKYKEIRDLKEFKQLMDYQHSKYGELNIDEDVKYHDMVASISSHNVDNLNIQQASNIYGDNIVKESVLKEIENMSKNKVWEFVQSDQISEEIVKKAIPSKLFLKMKFKSDGTPDKLKSRLVAGGHKQWNLDSIETYAPTAATESILSVLAIGKPLKLRFFVTDIPCAYLHASLRDPVYMKIHRSISDLINQDLKHSDGYTYVKLKKCLYGLRQSGNQWNKLITTWFLNNGYQSCEADKCILFRKIGDNVNIVCIHVDDILFGISDFDDFESVKTKLEKDFNVNKFESDKFDYLGMKITQQTNWALSISY